MPNCELCGEPMPTGEEMFKYHGYSGPCPVANQPAPFDREALVREFMEEHNAISEGSPRSKLAQTEEPRFPLIECFTITVKAHTNSAMEALKTRLMEFSTHQGSTKKVLEVIVESCDSLPSPPRVVAALRDLRERDVALELACELHACASKNCTAARYRKDGKTFLERLESAEREAAELRTRIAELTDNPAKGFCSICATTIWNRHPMIEENGVQFHPLCKVGQMLDTAEAELAALRADREKAVKMLRGPARGASPEFYIDRAIALLAAKKEG